MMNKVESAIRNYRYFIGDHIPPFTLPIQITSALVTVVLSYLLFYRVSTTSAQHRAAIVLGGLTAISLLIAAYELWYWGEVTFSVTINIVPVLLMDAIVAFIFRFKPKGIATALLFVIFSFISLMFVANTVFGELIPINRLEGGGLHAKTKIVQPGVVADSYACISALCV